MKILIITLHRVFNYGSVLQTYATQKFFESLGCEAEIIDYIPKQWQNKALFWDINEDKGFIKNNIYRCARAFSVILKKLTFGGFLRKKVKMTKKYYSPGELKSFPPNADVYCAGSDQIWNSKYNGIDDAFFLNFLPENSRKIAYASSFGKKKLDYNENNEIKSLIESYELLTLRESSAVSIIENMGLYGKQVIDPTLQINSKNWIKLASKRLVKEKYLVLMLLYNEDNNATSMARKIADEKGLKLVKISWELFKDSRVDILMTHRRPEEFISLIYYADYIVTNSFHGMAFCINLNKQPSI